MDHYPSCWVREPSKSLKGQTEHFRILLIFLDWWLPMLYSSGLVAKVPSSLKAKVLAFAKAQLFSQLLKIETLRPL
jgi:hypothetical protein